MNVGIDIDGVLFPWADAANTAVMERFGVPDPGPHVEWEHLKNVLRPHQWAWLWGAAGQFAVFGQVGRVYPGAAEAFGTLLAYDAYACHFVTHRDPVLAGPLTAEYLEVQFAPTGRAWDGLHVLRGTPKHELIKWDVFIDDKPETVRAMLAYTDALVFAPARPWNTELGALRHPRFLRYNHPAVVPEVLGLT